MERHHAIWIQEQYISNQNTSQQTDSFAELPLDKAPVSDTKIKVIFIH